jgi:hypothetical protein
MAFSTLVADHNPPRAWMADGTWLEFRTEYHAIISGH